ncbi:MAG: FAD binding domain-containing protein [Paracoccaceae bacterium]|nr:FAD binding domain-containing protein [Paracoccaceae bacterium]
MPIEITRTDDPGLAARLIANDRGAYVMGGGTGLMRRIHEGDQAVRHLILLSGPRLRQIAPERGGFFIGAQASMADVLAAPEARALHQPAASVGAPALRNMATVGGNLFARPPYGDLTTALLALDAEAVTASGSGEDRRPLALLLEDRTTRRLVLGVFVPDQGGARLHYTKMTRSHPRGASIVTVAASLARSGGRVTMARVAFGGLAGAPFRASGVERALTGGPLGSETIATAAERIGDGITPMSDALASGWYRLEMAKIHLRRLLGTAQGSPS